MRFYELLLKKIPTTLTYQSETGLRAGDLVRVQLKKKPSNALVLRETSKPSYACSDVQEVLMEQALSPLQIELCRWMSSHYFASLSKCIQQFLPTVVWDQKRKPKRGKDGQLTNSDQHPIKPHHQQPLTVEQEQVLEVLFDQPRKQKSLRSHPSSPSFLLHGITGSGKTEVYLQVIKKVIQNNQQALLLVPEIALTTELIQHFSEHFAGQISIIHSKLSDGERLQAWNLIREQKTKLILGSRSALFTPWKNLGVIIIDEEHEWTYKQESSPRYQAKTVAEKIRELGVGSSELGVRSSEFGVGSLELDTSDTMLLLGSATPSIESYYEASKLRTPHSQLLMMSERTNRSKLPPVAVVDLRDEYLKGNKTMFSDQLQQAIQDRLDRKEQVILFLNKRGSASSLCCRDCGYSPRCQNCDIALTFHARLKDFTDGGLICHYCGVFQKNITTCTKCTSSAIREIGAGTQKAELQLQQLFPTARILRADKDTTGGKKDFEDIYHQMRRGEADILLGTQMIAKGLDLSNVTLTGVIIADIGLHIPDFRASERVFQLLTQVGGRSGRHKPGEVIIQTYQPDHPAIQFAKKHDYAGFYQQEITIREQFFYPPYSNLVKLIYAHEDAKKAATQARQFYEELQLCPSDQHIDLAPHYIPKLHGKYIWNIYLRGSKPLELLKQVQLPVGWKVDVDPR
ncbi:MAG: primosomal protein N' [bacterium]|nr:primosomal protein N' [bacterium]